MTKQFIEKFATEAKEKLEISPPCPTALATPSPGACVPPPPERANSSKFAAFCFLSARPRGGHFRRLRKRTARSRVPCARVKDAGAGGRSMSSCRQRRRAGCGTETECQTSTRRRAHGQRHRDRPAAGSRPRELRAAHRPCARGRAAADGSRPSVRRLFAARGARRCRGRPHRAGTGRPGGADRRGGRGGGSRPHGHRAPRHAAQRRLRRARRRAGPRGPRHPADEGQPAQRRTARRHHLARCGAAYRPARSATSSSWTCRPIPSRSSSPMRR